MPGEVARARVAHGHRGVAREQQLRQRLAHQARAPDHDGLGAFDGDAVVVEDLDASAGRARHHGRLAREQITQAHGVQAVDVLGRRDGIDGRVFVQPLGQRQLEEDAVNRWIGVDLLDGLDELAL